MRVFRIFGRSVSNSFKSIFRNLSLSMASIVCTIITLILVSIGILLSHNINSITTDIENVLTIVIFLDKDATDDDVDSIESLLKGTDNIDTVEFNSKDEIKEQLRSQGNDYAEIINSWDDDENPLHDSFVVTVININDINETATTIKNFDKIHKVKYGESMVNDLINVFDGVKNGTIVLVVALILVTTFLIGNTIKITIFSRKNEIDIMRLVGTSNTVIKLPFIIEGFLLGAIGSILPILMTIIGYTFLYDKLDTAGMSNILNVIKLAEPATIIYTTSLILFAVGSIVGMFGSIRAVRKYLTI